ncbi:hypothetical protein PsorP6_008472 [Peronosclerospora sorghi]|uniref:Uncharacterized protein n=1 Tax=Peronosclerospora sorghi TaxID=230839 RepID=A0ACC0W8I1_9STRA|nr:hypothetical protein PsorP6_008472 [Peronosclerospora sorghi]
MWRLYRIPQHLFEAAQKSVVRAPFALQHLGGVNWYFTSIAGVNRDLLLSRSARDLQNELTPEQMGRIIKALRHELADAIACKEVTSSDIIDLFKVAKKTRASSIMLDAFSFLETNYPTQIDFSIYGEIFRIVSRKNNPNRLIQIYERSKPRFKAVPEMIYRFGIVGYLQKNDSETAEKIWQEMLDSGHETTNEITSRFMLAYARKGEVEKVQELYESVDPHIGVWHESCIDRVILSMGIIKQPSKAFEFYSNSSMKLNGGTLITLLSVCMNNNCKQEASDILANRKKFDLRLDARGYNQILTTLEFLERNDEIEDILKEMIDNGVRFDTKTDIVIKRNAQFLKDANIAADSGKDKSAGYTFSPRIREMLVEGRFSEAAALADSIVVGLNKSHLPANFDGEIPEGALIVSPNVARDVVQAYIKTGQDNKVAALVKGFSILHGKYTFALDEVVNQYLKQKTKTGDELSYAACKAILFQGSQIYRVKDALMLFHRFHDFGAALKLFGQVLNLYCGEEVKNAKGVEKAPNKLHYVNFNIGNVIDLVMQTLVENGKMTEALDALNMLESRSLKLTSKIYVTILRAMCKHVRDSSRSIEKKQVAYTTFDVQTLLKDLKDRGLKVNRVIVGNLYPAYKGANKQQRLQLLEAFSEAQRDPNDKYVLSHMCYETLMTFTAQEGTTAELKELYNEAVSTLDKMETCGVPSRWVSILIEKLVEVGNIEEAEQLVEQMPDLCRGYTLRAMLAVLRGAMETQQFCVVDNMVALIEKSEFQISLSDAYKLVHLAVKLDLALKSLDIIRLFEKSNLKEVAPASNGLGNLEEAYFRRQCGDIHALRKVRTMYTVALKACEKGRHWKEALVLRDQMTTLLGEKAVNEITALLGTSPKRRKEMLSVL